jgi:hypothetical protein
VRSLTGQALTLLMDLVVPVGAYYLLRALDVAPLTALILAGLPTTVFLLGQAVRKRRIDALGVFVLILLAAGVAVSLVTGSPRFLLAKGGWFTAVIGLAFLATLVLARPLTFTLARAMLRRTPMGQRLATESWDDLWERDREFRRPWRVATVLWGGGLLADAAARVVMAYTLPVDAVPGIAAGLWIVTFLMIQIVQQLHFARSGLWRRLHEHGARQEATS